MLPADEGMMDAMLSRQLAEAIRYDNRLGMTVHDRMEVGGESHLANEVQAKFKRVQKKVDRALAYGFNYREIASKFDLPVQFVRNYALRMKKKR